MKRIPFDILKAKAGAKVVNRSGKKVRILADDVKIGCDEKIIYHEIGGNVYAVGMNGLYSSVREDMIDLFLEVEPKYVPYTWETSAEIVGKAVTHKKELNECLVIRRSANSQRGLTFFVGANETCSPGYFLNNWTFLDGSPCGTLEE